MLTMKTNHILTLSLLLIIFGSGYAQDTYYWRNNQKQSLHTSYNYVYVLTNNSEDTIQIAKQLEEMGVQCLPFEKVSVGIHGYESGCYWSVVFLNDKKGISIANAQYTAPFFYTEKEELVGLSHLFYVRLHNLEDTIVLKKKAFEKGVKILGNNRYRPLWFTLACSSQSSGNAMEMANYFYETGHFANAEPDIMIPDLSLSVNEDIPCVNDSVFSSQWNLQNNGQNNGVTGIDINYCEVRQLTEGDQNVVIAVVDYGFDMHHTDITNVFPLSYDVMSLSSPAQVYHPHATACAGIIGARADNVIGVAGIAPGTHIPTTDKSGPTGYSFSDYFEFFNGTSSACPHVSAIAGLILSVNPCLTYTEVRTVIETTCTKIREDVYEYDTSSTLPNNTWNMEVGHGLVNAYAAVQLAQQMGGYTYIKDTIVTGNVTWAGNKMIHGRLVVDGGTLTSACAGEMWQGSFN